MKREVFPIKELPSEIDFSGDYYITQSALLLAALADKDITIYNYNSGIETDRTISFLESIGLNILKKESRLIVETGYGINIPENDTLSFDGSSFPLSLIIGLLAGQRQSCILQYSMSINPDIVDSIVEALNRHGIDVFHEADNNTIVFRTATEYPLEIKVSISVPHIKNCILTFAISSGIPCSVKEYKTTSNYLERTLAKYNIPLKITEPQTIFTEDPSDPRKKVKVRAADYKRELMLPGSIRIEESSFYVPNDNITALAMTTLAVLKRKSVTLNNFPINSVSRKFIDHLKSSAAEVNISRREEFGGDTFAVVEVAGRPIKARKMGAGQTSLLIDEVPFMAVIAALGDGTSLIRGIGDYNDCEIAPFNEIAENLGKMTVKCGILEDGLAIEGRKELAGTDFGSFANPQIALAFYVAALAAQGPSVFDNFEIILEHYPEFVATVPDRIDSPV